MVFVTEICHVTLPVKKFVFYGFQVLQGAVLLNKLEQLYLAFVLRMIDNK